MSENANGNVYTPRFRLSFPNLFEPSKPKNAPESQEKKYSCTMLFDEDADLSELKAAAAAAVKEKWGDNPPADMRKPFRDQGDKEYDGYVKGAKFITASSKQRPGVVDKNVKPIIDPADIYPGCYCIATVRAFAYGGKGTGFRPGVAFGLQNIQKVADGESLSGRTTAENDFAPIEGGDSTDGVDPDTMFD